jgi:hypothetical protein
MKTLILFIKEARVFFITCGILLYLTLNVFITRAIVLAHAKTPEQQAMAVWTFIGIILGTFVIAGIVYSLYLLIKWLVDKWEYARAETTVEKTSIVDPDIPLRGILQTSREIHLRIQQERLEGKTMDSTLIARALLPKGNKSDIETVASYLMELQAFSLIDIVSIIYSSNVTPQAKQEEPSSSRYDIAKRSKT